MARNCRACLAKAWSIFCLLTVEPAMFLVALGNGITDTATRVLMYDKVCIMLLNDVDLCVARNFTSEEEIIVQQEASLWEFYRTLTACLPAVFLIVIYSNLVDRWSKKYPMIFNPVGYILSMIIYLVCSIYIESSPGYMLIGSLAVGFSGGMLAMMGACFSYLSATASPGMLIIHISLAEAALLASTAISAFVSGVLLEAVGYVVVYFIGIVINVVLILYVLIRIKNIPLSASVLAQSDAAVASPSASEHPSSSPVDTKDALEEAEKVRQKVDDDELTIEMNVLHNLEMNGHLHLTLENELAPLEKIASGVEENGGTDKSNLGNGNLSQKNHVVQKVMEVETVVENGSLVAVALPTFSNGSSIPSKNSHNEPQLQETSADSSSLVPDAAKSTTCNACSLCSKAACTVWFYTKMYVNTAIKRREQNKRKGIIAILCIILVEVICSYAAAIGLCYLFVSHDPLSWSTATYGYYTGVMRGMKGFCLLVIVPLFKRLNVLYTKVIIISLVSSIISNTVFALSLYTWMAFLSAALGLFQTALIVTARSSIVNFVEEDEHGKAFGMIASLESLAFVLSSVIFNIIIYPATVHIFSGLAILIAALSLFLPLAVAIWLHVFTRKMARSHLQVIERTIN